MDQAMEGARLPVEAWFWETPVCTRWWTTATLLASALVQCRIVSPYQLFYSYRAVFHRSQVVCPNIVFLTSANLMASAVLAPRDVVPLLRSILDQSTLPHLLPPTILASSRRIIWPITSSLLLAFALRNGQSHRHVSPRLIAFPRASALFDSRIYLVPEKPRHAAQLLGGPRLHCSVPAVGVDGLQPHYARQHPQRRNHGRRHRAHLVLFHGCVPSSS